MFAKKEIEIYETDRSISIVLDWFSPVAYFLLFFCLMWCGFLVVWYSIVLAGGAPLMFALFPLIHVAVGLGLSYYTLCLFKNKTYIDVDKDYLSVTHKPIPWWKGNNDITIDSIKQLYVKEKVSRTKNGTSITYELRAKMKDGKDQQIFNLQSLESHQVIEIEQRLEHFMGIQDEPVRGEFGTGRGKVTIDVPRRQRRNFSESDLAFLYQMNSGDYINYKNEEQKISALTQYDWNDGDSDQFFQLIDEKRSEQLLYLEQNKAFLKAYSENVIPIGKTGLSVLPDDNPPPTLTIEGTTYYFSTTKKGSAFPSNVSRKLEVTQWLYQSEDKTRQVRFIDYDGQLTCYEGIQISESDFEKGLDLNKSPMREEEPLKRNWDEEDFV